MKQRHINLNPTDREVFKITYFPGRWRKHTWLLEAMRFIPHDGKAGA